MKSRSIFDLASELRSRQENSVNSRNSLDAPDRRSGTGRARQSARCERGMIARSCPPLASLLALLIARLLASRSGDRRRRSRSAGLDRPRGRADRRLARKFLHRRGHCARSRAHRRALRAARRRLQDRRIRGTRAAVTQRRERHRPSEIQSRHHAGATCDRRCGAAQARRSARFASSPRSFTGWASRSRRATASRLRAPALRCATTASRAEPSAPPGWLRPDGPGPCRSACSIPRRAARSRGSAPARVTSGGPVFGLADGRPAIIGVVSWSTGPQNAEGCGGLTGVTPLTLYRDWVTHTAKILGNEL